MTDLPDVDGYNALMVVVDKFSNIRFCFIGCSIGAAVGVCVAVHCTGQQGNCLADATGCSLHGQRTTQGQDKRDNQTIKHIQGKW